MNDNTNGNGQGRPRMSRLQWEQHLEDELAARKYHIALYEAGNIQKALAESRRRDSGSAGQQQTPRQGGPAQPPIVHGLRQETDERTNLPHVTQRSLEAQNQTRAPELPRQEQHQMQHQGIRQPTPHGLPFDRASEPAAQVPIAADIADNLIDLTSLSDVEDSKPQPRVDNVSPVIAPTQQQQTQSRLGMQLGNQLAPQITTTLFDQPLIQAQEVAENQIVPQIGTPLPIPTPHQAQGMPKKSSSPYEPPYKEFPTLLRDPDGDGYIELRCPVCGGNASGQHNLQNRLKHFTGAAGVQSHHRICHPSKIEKGGTKTLLETLRMSTYRKLTKVEVEDMLAKKAGTYAIGHYRAAPSEPDAKIRAPREQSKQKQPLKKAPAKKRTRVAGSSWKTSSKRHPAQSTESYSLSNKTVAGDNCNDDDDEEMPTKKHTRRL